MLDRRQALALLGRARGRAILDGAGGRSGADLEAVADVIVRLSELAAVNAGRFARIDVAPLVVLSSGGGCVVGEARITFEGDGPPQIPKMTPGGG